jgi:hypothetical protein
MLESELRAYLRSKPYRTPHEFDAKRGCYVFRLEVINPPPLRLSTIVGDLVHNTRSALDHLVWQLVLTNGGSPGHHTAFPIYTSQTNFVRNVLPNPKRRGESPLDGVSAEGHQMIDAMQPYHRSNQADLHPLAILSQADNIDKHRLLNHGYARSANEPPNLEAVFTEASPDGGAQVIYPANVALEDGAEVLYVQLIDTGEGEPDLKIEGGLPVEITFGERRLLPTDLAGLCDVVEDIVERSLGTLVV